MQLQHASLSVELTAVPCHIQQAHFSIPCISAFGCLNGAEVRPNQVS